MSTWGGKPIVRVFAKHEPEPERFAEVLFEMIERGPPTIHCVLWRGQLFAIEGSHRLAAAWALGWPPRLVVLAADRIAQADEDAGYEALKGKLPSYAWFEEE